MGAIVPSNYLPPWLLTHTPLNPIETAKAASSTVIIPFKIIGNLVLYYNQAKSPHLVYSMLSTNILKSPEFSDFYLIEPNY